MILDFFKLDGKVALVTGAGQGLGQAMALALAEAGADIAGLDRTAAKRQAKPCAPWGDATSRWYAICVDGQCGAT